MLRGRFLPRPPRWKSIALETRVELQSAQLSVTLMLWPLEAVYLLTRKEQKGQTRASSSVEMQKPEVLCSVHTTVPSCNMGGSKLWR